MVVGASQTPDVRIEMTVAFGDRERDVRVEAPDDDTLGAVLTELAGAVGAPHDAPPWVGNDLLGVHTALADRRLRSGTRLRFGGTDRPIDRSTVLALHVAGGPAAGRVVPLERRRLTIGRAADNDVVLPDADVSRHHAVLAVTATDITMYDAGSTNGTWFAGRALPADGIRLHVGDVVRVGASLLTIAGPPGPPASVRPGPDGTVLLDRAASAREPVGDRVITVPTCAAPGRPRPVQWVTALLPAAAGVAIAWTFGQPEFLLFALLSPAMLISSALGDRVHWRRTRRRSAAQLRTQRAAIDREIARALLLEASVRRRAVPDPADLRRAVALPDTRVWARRRGDRDLLEVRLGVADLPATLAVRDGTSVAPAGTLADTPLCVDLRPGPLGLAGPDAPVQAAARWIVGQLAARAAPADIEFALLLDEGRAGHWRWMRWLPQLRGKVAVNSDECADLVHTITSVVEQREAGSGSGSTPWSGPWLVVVIDRPASDAVARLVEVLARGAAVGVTGVWLAANPAALPACCAATARVEGVTGSRIVVRNSAGAEHPAVLDQVAIRWADELARDLAPLTDSDGVGEAGLPGRCELLEVLDARPPSIPAVTDRWDASSGGARTVIGLGAAAPVSVDLATDGPHALIAGTTGAGKSELLRTIVATLALAQPPDAVNLLLIDYKGGAAFAECAALPHVAGLVTDLDRYLTERALRSLRAELRRREQLFADAGATDLLGYRRARPGEPIPRLVIVVDEFATLADELPDFVSGLVNVARLGRSFGLHLVLATQRPGGAISPEIRTNTELRICLRVADPSESSDVIDSPLAASIERSAPGRGYLRTGSALTCFQTAYSSGSDAYDGAAARVQLLDEWRRAPDLAPTADSPLARLVDVVVAAAAQRGLGPAPSPWQPPLPDLVCRAELDPPAHSHAVPLGRVDLPDEQRQPTLEFDLTAHGSLLLAGAARSGRTTALTNVALGAASANSPTNLHMQVIDATGDLARLLRPLPHAVTLLGPAELDLVPRLLTRLGRAAADRLVEVTSRSEPIATTLVLIDGWDAVCAALSDAEGAACAETLSTLLRVAPSVGYAIAVTGDRAVVAPRFAGGFAEQLLLRLPDRHDRRIGGAPSSEVSARFPPGRAIRGTDGALVQLALSAKSSEDVHAQIAATARRWGSAEAATSAVRVRPLPDEVRLAELPAAPGRFVLGLAGDDPTPALADPFAGPARWLVVGPPRSGRTTLLRLLAAQAYAAGVQTLVAATERSALLADARGKGVPVIGPTTPPVPLSAHPTLVLVDDSEAFADTEAGARLVEWARDRDLPLALVAAGRADDLATSYRGVAAEVRRHRFGVLLRPGPLDGELFGLRLPRHGRLGPPGRGVALADPTWGAAFADGGAVPIQVAMP